MNSWGEVGTQFEQRSVPAGCIMFKHYRREDFKHYSTVGQTYCAGVGALETRCSVSTAHIVVQVQLERWGTGQVSGGLVCAIQLNEYLPPQIYHTVQDSGC